MKTIISTALGFALLAGVARRRRSRHRRHVRHGRRKPAPVRPATTADYRLAAGDKLRIEVYKDAQLSQSLQVRPDGKITLPLVGDVAAAGRTSVELRDAIAARSRNTSPTRSSPSSSPRRRRQVVYVTGEVNKPGALHARQRPDVDHPGDRDGRRLHRLRQQEGHPHPAQGRVRHADAEVQLQGRARRRQPARAAAAACRATPSSSSRRPPCCHVPSLRAPSARRAGAAALSAAAPAAAQERPTELQSWHVPGWTLHARRGFGALYDTNVAIAAPGRVRQDARPTRCCRSSRSASSSSSARARRSRPATRGRCAATSSSSSLDGIDHRALPVAAPPGHAARHRLR